MKKSTLALILVCYVSAHGANGLLLKWLALQAVPAPWILVGRGLGCLACSVLFAAAFGRSLKPISVRLQSLRMALSGVALSLITASYQFVHASTVGLISRLDTPLLLALGTYAGMKVKRCVRVGAAGTLVLFLAFVTLARRSGEPLAGIALALSGTLAITFGFVLLKNASKRENISVIAGIAGAAVTLFGGVLVVVFQQAPPTGVLLLASLLGGAVMFAIYALTIRLYRIMDVAQAEYPTLISALLLVPGEALLFGIEHETSHILLMGALFLAMSALIAIQSSAARARSRWRGSSTVQQPTRHP